MLYAVEGRDMDCLEPFFRLPTIWAVRLEEETGNEGGRDVTKRKKRNKGPDSGPKQDKL